MKRIVLIALGAAMILGTAATAMAESTAADYTVYSFEDGVKPGKLATASDKAEIVDGGVFGSNKALKVELSTNPVAGWKLPIYMTEGIAYNISYYCKAGDASTLDMRPLLYIGTTPYNVTPNMTGETLTPVGNDWYYYTTKYKAEATGEGTLELRKLSAIASNANTYFIDDVVVEPVDKTGYSNILLNEDFNDAKVGASSSTYMTTYNTSNEVNIAAKEDDTKDHYATVTSSSAQVRMRTKNTYSFDPNKKYRLTFDAMGVSGGAATTKCMWGINGLTGTYFYNTDSDKMTESKWKTFTSEFTGVNTSALANPYIFTSSTSAARGTYALDNIKIEEVVPRISGVTTSTPAIGEELTAAITGDAEYYLYRVYAVDSDNHAAIAANGTAVDKIKYTPTAADAGKTLKFVVTAYDTAHVYNTVETVTEAVPVPVTQTSELKFTSGLGSEITGTAVQYTGSNAIAFLAAYDSEGRLIGITTATVPSGSETPITLSGISAPVKAKLAMFDNKTDLNQIVQEATIAEE